MDDPLSRALAEAPHRSDEHRGDVSRHHTDHAPALSAVLAQLRAQLVDALNVPFFDAGVLIDTIPVTKHARSAMGAETVAARRHEPAYEAEVTIEVRCDLEDVDAGAYEVRARGRLRCDDRRGRTDRAVAVQVAEIDGRLRLDELLLREEMAEAIRAIGSA